MNIENGHVKYSPSSSISAGYNISVNESFDFHFHDHYELYLFISGQGEMMVEKTRYPLTGGSLMVFNSNEIHRVSPASDIPYERLTVHFSSELITSLPVNSRNLLSCFNSHRPGIGNAAVLSGKSYDNYLQLAKKLVHTLKENNKTLGLAYLIELLYAASMAFSNPAYDALPFEGIITDAIDYIEMHLTDEIKLSDLAGSLNVDLFYLCHRFKTEIGASPYHYILMRRIALAKQLLAKGHSCMEVCSKSGFGDYNNFARTFKKYVGLSPGAYRKQQ